MAKGYYNILHNEDKTDLIFEIKPDLGIEIPDEQQNLVIDIGNTLATLRFYINQRQLNLLKLLTNFFT